MNDAKEFSFRLTNESAMMVLSPAAMIAETPKLAGLDDRSTEREGQIYRLDQVR